MEKDPLLPTTIPVKRRKLSASSVLPSILWPLPEDAEVSLPPPSPTLSSSFKDRLIFGPHPADASDADAALNLILPSTPPRSPSVLRSPHLHLSCATWGDGDDDREQGYHPPTSAPPPPRTLKTNLHRSRTAPAMAAINDVDDAGGAHRPHREPRPRSASIVLQAVLLLAAYLSTGIILYLINRENFVGKETHPVVDALYFCIVTMCTIGYGDIIPQSISAKLLSIAFVIIGFGFVDILLSGMVSYVLDVQESLLLSAVKGGKGARSYLVDVKKGRMRIRMKVGLALGVVMLCIGVGMGVMHFVERLGWLDSFYLSVMSVTTVGYGDWAFKSLPGRVFASVWLLVSTLAVARAFLYLAEARIDKRHRMIAKWVLGRDMTISEFLAADVDHNGFVSKSDYVVYKLKEIGKITEKDVVPVCEQFDRLDKGNCGKITLRDLVESHH